MKIVPTTAVNVALNTALPWQREKQACSSPATRRVSLLLPVLLILSIAACSRPAPEVRLEEAGDALKSVSNDLDSVGEEIERLETKLAERRKQRRKLAEQKMTLEERLESRATDVALFRAVQSKLLNSDKLKDSAITVAAQSRAVTLEGLVASADKEAAAVSIARSVAGVTEVDSRLQIDSPDGDKATSSGE